jgi:hypothetical protein
MEGEGMGATIMLHLTIHSLFSAIEKSQDTINLLIGMPHLSEHHTSGPVLPGNGTVERRATTDRQDVQMVLGEGEKSYETGSIFL